MLPLGLVRHAGTASTKGNLMQWEATPSAEIEAARERYEVLTPTKSRRARTSPGARLAELRQMEHGDPRRWHPVRDKILATLPLLTETVKMAFWESVPIDELELALAEIEELHEATMPRSPPGASVCSIRRTKPRSTSCGGQMAARRRRKRSRREAEALRKKLIQT